MQRPIESYRHWSRCYRIKENSALRPFLESTWHPSVLDLDGPHSLKELESLFRLALFNKKIASRGARTVISNKELMEITGRQSFRLYFDIREILLPHVEKVGLQNQP
jgi:hypothetical protein